MDVLAWLLVILIVLGAIAVRRELRRIEVQEREARIRRGR